MLKTTVGVYKNSNIRTNYTGLQDAVDRAIKDYGRIHIVSSHEAFKNYTIESNLSINPTSIVGYLTELDINSDTVDVYLNESRIPKGYDFSTAELCMLVIADTKAKVVQKIVKAYILSGNLLEIE